MDKVDVRLPKTPKAPPANVPKTAEERAMALVGLMVRLAAHLDRETAAARGRASTAEMAALAKAKEPMALVYEEISRLLRVDREGMTALPEELKAELRAATKALAASAAANTELLRSATASQNVLVDTVVASVNRARRSNQPAYGPAAAGYSSPQHRRDYGTPRHGPATSGTLNTRL